MAVRIDVQEILVETDNAFLVLYNGEEIWLPKSQITYPEDYEAGTSGEMVISNWIARQKGIEGEDVL